MTWNTETFATNQNANAIRFGTLYNFRFDADQPPQTANATVGFFKTGSPMMVAIQAPQAAEARLRRHQPPRPRQLQRPRLRCDSRDCHTETHSNTKGNLAKASPNSAAAPLALLPAQWAKVKSLLEIIFC